MNNEVAIGGKGNDEMGDPKMKAEDVEALAEWLEIKMKPGNSATIASVLSEIRRSVYAKASSLQPAAIPVVQFGLRRPRMALRESSRHTVA
jgi:hypothetical protein